MAHMCKNYFTNGGDTLVIGGHLKFKGAKSQSKSTATTIASLKDDFNTLLTNLKEIGIVQPDSWNISVRLAPSLTDTVAASNNTKASVAFEDKTIIIYANVDELEESTSSVAEQGTHKWIGLGIGTGLSSVTLATYNGAQLTDDDASEAVSVGLDQPGEFVLYVRADELVDTPKTITLDADGYSAVNIEIIVAQRND